ncbi:MAG TPA: glycoside hydrolase family 16 protein, partial [Euzebyales bacterium]|nr:glycoside hydrolase family 16 protein [Euzebyales bacterium]
DELQYYTDSTDNAALDGDGHLVVTAREGNPEGFTCWYGPCTHTSARMNTAGRFAQQYGRIEARIRIPTGQGVWPAFWMLGVDFGEVGWPASGEIDVMENVGHEPGVVHGTVHGPGYSGGDGISGSTTLPDGASFSDAFHVYAVEWTPEQITWLVDDVAYHAVTPEDLGGNAWVFDHPFFLILNVAVGGNWPGDPDATTSFPQEMLVDYVRVHDLDAG